MDKISQDFAGIKYTFESLAGHRIAITKYEKLDSTKHTGKFYYKIQFIIKEGEKTQLGFTTSGADQIVKVLDMKPKVPCYRTVIKTGRSFFFAENMASTEETKDEIIKNLGVDINQL